MRDLGFEKEYVSAADINKVFDQFDTAKNGKLEFEELDKGIMRSGRKVDGETAEKRLELQRTQTALRLREMGKLPQ